MTKIVLHMPGRLRARWWLMRTYFARRRASREYWFTLTPARFEAVKQSIREALAEEQE